MTGELRKLKLISGSLRSQPAPPKPEKRLSPIYQFGPFQLDVGRYDLRRDGHRVRLAPAPMKLLLLFVERPGALIDREDIVNSLWSSPSMVDVDQGINTAIRRIRQVLRDDSANPRYIETVVGKGYRFIAEVKVVDSAQNVQPAASPAIQNEPELGKEEELRPPVLEIAPPPAQPAEENEEKRARRKRISIWAVSFAALLLLAAVCVGWWIFHRPHRYIATLSQVTANDTEQRVTTAAISPDGKWIAYSDVNGLYLRLLQSGKTVTLNAPEAFQAERIAWYPDQTRLLVSGFDTQFANLEIWTVSITGAPPQLFRKDAHSGVPSPDGAQIAFLPANDREIWVAGADGDGAHRLLTDPAGKTFSQLFWGGNAKRVSYRRSVVNGTETGDYESADAATGQVLAREKIYTFYAAFALADGRMFYLSDAAPHTGDNFSLWEVNTDPASGAFVSQPAQIAVLPKERAFGLTGTEDGSRLSFIGSKGAPHVYVARLALPGPALADVTRLTHDTRNDYPHAWLHDNETVIFESDRVSAYRIYGQRLQDPDAREFNTGSAPAVLPQVTPDGKWILYAMNPDTFMSPRSRLFRVPVVGGTAEQVDLHGPLQEFSCPLRSGSCVLLEIEGHKYFHYYALDPLAGKGRELARTSWVPHVLHDWDIAPDGSAVVVSVHDAGTPRIRIVPLGHSAGAERELKVRAYGMPSGVNWAADGQGWYVSSDTGAGTLMLYVNQQGASHILRIVPLGTWGVPSPDGTKLAFIDEAVDSNVWMWEISRRR